jgi:hypothetical protein
MKLDILAIALYGLAKLQYLLLNKTPAPNKNYYKQRNANAYQPNSRDNRAYCLSSFPSAFFSTPPFCLPSFSPSYTSFSVFIKF